MSPWRAQQGYTLIELLLSLVLGLIVASAAFAILDFSLHFTNRITDRIDATQLGRNAMDRITQELHSACMAAGITPIQSAITGVGSSDDKNIVFESQFGSQPTLTPTLHRITFTPPSPAGAGNGTLTDTTYSLLGGTTPANWTFNALLPKTTTIVRNVAQATVNGVQLPVFQYFLYTGAQLSNTALAVPLGAANAAATAQVTVSFATNPSTASASGPSSVNTRLDRTANLTDSVVFRVSPTNPTQTNLPCG
jgi:prepilin-type N-terminal cleavage/methylation domain-containing protein